MFMELTLGYRFMLHVWSHCFPLWHRIAYGESSVGQDLGYCPQEDALDRYLTGEETLQFYARMRGLPDNYRKYVSLTCLAGMITDSIYWIITVLIFYSISLGVSLVWTIFPDKTCIDLFFIFWPLHCYSQCSLWFIKLCETFSDRARPNTEAEADPICWQGGPHLQRGHEEEAVCSHLSPGGSRCGLPGQLSLSMLL